MAKILISMSSDPLSQLIFQHMGRLQKGGIRQALLVTSTADFILQIIFDKMD